MMLPFLYTKMVEVEYLVHRHNNQTYYTFLNTIHVTETMWKKAEPAMEGDAHGQDPDDHLVGNVQHLLEHRG